MKGFLRNRTVSLFYLFFKLTYQGYCYSPVNLLVAKREGNTFKHVGMTAGQEKEKFFKTKCDAGTYYAYVKIYF
jgi:hypothetical protein